MRKMFGIVFLSLQFLFCFSGLFIGVFFSFFVFCSFMALKKCVRKNWQPNMNSSVEQQQYTHTHHSYSRHSSSSDSYQLIELTDNGITHGTHEIGCLAVCLSLCVCVCARAQLITRANFQCYSIVVAKEIQRKIENKYFAMVLRWASFCAFVYVCVCVCVHIKSQTSRQSVKQPNK